MKNTSKEIMKTTVTMFCTIYNIFIFLTNMLTFHSTGTKFHHNKSSKSVKTIKTKKCQPAASHTPDLIQTECVADSWLARPKNKSFKSRKTKMTDVSLKSSKTVSLKSSKCVKIIKTKKCQPAASHMLDLIQTECVADRGLAHLKTKKSTEQIKYKKYKLKNGISEQRCLKSGRRITVILIVLFLVNDSLIQSAYECGRLTPVDGHYNLRWKAVLWMDSHNWTKTWFLPNKIRNKYIKSKNGNRDNTVNVSTGI